MILLMPEQQQAAARAWPAGTAAPLCRRGSPRGPWSRLPLPTLALQTPPRDHRDAPKPASDTPKPALLAFTHRAPGPHADGIPRCETRWEQVGVSPRKGLEMPPDHHSPPEAAHQVPIERAVNLHRSCHLRGSGLHAAAGKTGSEEEPAPGIPPSRPPHRRPLGTPWGSRRAPLPSAHHISRVLGRCSPLPPPKLSFWGPANPIRCCEGSEQAGRRARRVNQAGAAQPPLYTRGARPPQHPGAPLPGAGPTGRPPPGWDPAHRLSAHERSRRGTGPVPQRGAQAAARRGQGAAFWGFRCFTHHLPPRDKRVRNHLASLPRFLPDERGISTRTNLAWKPSARGQTFRRLKINRQRGATEVPPLLRLSLCPCPPPRPAHCPSTGVARRSEAPTRCPRRGTDPFSQLRTPTIGEFSFLSRRIQPATTYPRNYKSICL